MTKFNMDNWLNSLISTNEKKSMPLLSFPSISKLGCTVKDLVTSSDLQAKGMKLVADQTPSLASVSFMDLSVEAEAFGSNVEFAENDVPTIIGSLITSIEDAENLAVPPIGAKRTGIYIDAVKKAKELIVDRPIFAGIIGSFSLAGRLLDVTEALVCCYTEPELVHSVLQKCTGFLIEYAKAYKKAGANGIIIAEPLTGLLSPELASEFSEPYIKRISSAVKDENFAVIYHNCGNTTLKIMDSILKTNCSAYHFGNAVDMKEVLKIVPKDVIVMGNIDPVSQFKNGSVDSIKTQVTNLLEECKDYSNFVISSGCDIPHDANWQKIHAYYQAIKEFYKGV